VKQLSTGLIVAGLIVAGLIVAGLIVAGNARRIVPNIHQFQVNTAVREPLQLSCIWSIGRLMGSKVLR
jgi:hypothetical protein